MRILRTHRGVTSAFDIPTKLSALGTLNVSITENFGTPEALTVSFPIPAPEAATLVRQLHKGMNLDNPNTELPIYTVELDP